MKKMWADAKVEELSLEMTQDPGNGKHTGNKKDYNGNNGNHNGWGDGSNNIVGNVVSNDNSESLVEGLS